MKFKNIFKNQEQRRSEELERQANLERLSDASEKLHHDAFKYIDLYFDHVGINEAVKAIKIWRGVVSEIHKMKIEHATAGEIIAIKNNLFIEEFNKFKVVIETLDRDLKGKCRDGLKDLKHTLIQHGDMDIADKYIFKKRRVFLEEIMLFAKNDLTLISLEIANLAPENEKLKDIEYLVSSLKENFHRNRSVSV